MDSGIVALIGILTGAIAIVVSYLIGDRNARAQARADAIEDAIDNAILADEVKNEIIEDAARVGAIPDDAERNSAANDLLRSTLNRRRTDRLCDDTEVTAKRLDKPGTSSGKGSGVL